MISDPIIKVCIKTKQYNAAYKKSGHDNRHDFNSSIGLAADVDYTPAYSYITMSESEANKRYKPYIIKGGIPMGGYEELIIVDEKLFDYSKIKYEFYND